MQLHNSHDVNHGTSPLAIFIIFLKLGCTSFGGPIAHLGYMRHEFVERRRWLDEPSYADLVALCQFLPGPASSQLGIALGIARAGISGGFAAWLGFTTPSAIALILFALSFEKFGFSTHAGWLHGLKVVAVAVVAQAVLGMGKALCPDRLRASLAVAATIIVLAWPAAGGQIVAIAIGAALGVRYLQPVEFAVAPMSFPISHRAAITAWILFFSLLILLPVAVAMTGDHTLTVFDRFYRAGSLVFGGGHVVLPLLRDAVVPPGWITDDAFLAGYGAAQAVPGPLFTFAGYLGTAMNLPPNGVRGAILCIGAIFLPAFLLVVGALPYWDALRRRNSIQCALQGINASVVGILLAALYDPVWTSSIRSTADFALALIAFVLLTFWKQSPLRVVIFTALGGAALTFLPS